MVRDRKDTSRWCLYAWIFWHPVARAAPLTPQAGLMHLGREARFTPLRNLRPTESPKRHGR